MVLILQKRHEDFCRHLMKYSRIDITRDPFWFSLSQIIFLLKTGRLFLSLKISPLKTLPSKNLSLKNYPEEIYPQKSYPQKFTLEEINLEKNYPQKINSHKVCQSNSAYTNYFSKILRFCAVFLFVFLPFKFYQNVSVLVYPDMSLRLK